ncbi:unnamed protein product [Paramecium sonneborni]|uniref:Uncharacterized protein n=1 Tax=Paramecium sonneborni TaxID=65129 RepID=A0A8S1RIE7_9CILI|nr:unnamed protein product [Paramecium sonneborni]
MKNARCMEYLIDQFHLDDVIPIIEQNSLIGINEDSSIIVIYRQNQLEHYQEIDGQMKLMFKQSFQFKDSEYRFIISSSPTRIALNKEGDLLLIEINKTLFNLFYKKAHLKGWTHFYSNKTKILQFQSQNDKYYEHCMLKDFNSSFNCFFIQKVENPATIMIYINLTSKIKKIAQKELSIIDCVFNEANNIIIGREQNYLNIYKWKKVIPFQQINLTNGLLFARFDQQNNLILLTKVHLEIYIEQFGQTYQKVKGIPIINNNQIYDIVPIDTYILILRTYLGKNFAEVNQIEDNTIQIVGQITCRQIKTSLKNKFYLAVKDKQIEIYKHN